MKRVLAVFFAVFLCLAFALPCRAKDIAAGGSVMFGCYEQDNDLTNGAEPIEWQVLAVDGGKALLITRYAIDSRQFHDCWADVTWEASRLRAWLNDAFYTDAFTQTQRAAILETALETPDNGSYGTDGGADTVDRLFILSVGEARQYLASAAARKAQGTALAVKRQLYVKQTGANAGNCWWWLRNTGQTADTAVFVKEDGNIFFKGFDVDFYSCGIRPAMWVDSLLLP